ncbi:MAG: DUF3995 domain-containing protein [Candidatus Dormibacteraeota bacterium]|nr:DUF3995 domain-containing protein [Candidatus Dormibacteraeota bacterium]MBO0761414.1 DUF3995 domain-containing protein [Candidatus Dormibacteraeota bacterium]
MSAQDRTAWLSLPASGAAAWAFAFAAVSFYWAAGGTMLGDTVGADLRSLALQRAPAFVAVLWATGGLKVTGGLLGLALAGAGGSWLPRLGLLILGWGGWALLAVYGGVPLIVDGLQFAGLLAGDGPRGLDRTSLAPARLGPPGGCSAGSSSSWPPGPSRPGPAADTARVERPRSSAVARRRCGATMIAACFAGSPPESPTGRS